MIKGDMVVEKKFHIVYLGETGFPYGLASIQKLILISKALIADGAKVTVINRKGKFSPDKNMELPVEGVHEGIHYIYTSGSIYRPKGFIARNLKKFRGLIGEFWYLWQLKQKKELQAAIISCYSFQQVALYRLYGYLLNFPLVLNYVEMASVMQHRRSLFQRVNDFLFDRLLVPRMDGALAISEVLMKNFKQVAPDKGLLKVPILCDFEQFNLPKKTPENVHFLYCGALDYREVIDFILEAFNQLPAETDAYLYLVLGGGNQAQREHLETDIRKLQKGTQVKVFYDVPHKKIPSFYLPASALLIPLRPTLQDAARFPHKIGEYIASGNPMISTNYGEVAHYFQDGENALIAESYDVHAFAEKMKIVLNHPNLIREIGQKGKELGLREFNYLNYGPKIKAFIEKL